MALMETGVVSKQKPNLTAPLGGIGQKRGGVEAWRKFGLCKPYQTKEWVLKAFSTPNEGFKCNLQNQEGRRKVLNGAEGANPNPKDEEGPRGNFTIGKGIAKSWKRRKGSYEILITGRGIWRKRVWRKGQRAN